jgi:hypothetical protein
LTAIDWFQILADFTGTSQERRTMRRRIGALVATTAVALLAASPALAHDCFNPNKPAGAGVNYTVVGFTADGPIFEQTGPGKGIGGFATISPELTGGVVLPDVHTIGNSSVKEEVGGPGSLKPEHACDGKGIDFLEACGG